MHSHPFYLHGSSYVHRIPAHVAVAGLLVFIVAVVATPRDALWAFAIHGGVVAGAAATARVRPGFMLRRLLVVTPFLVFAAFVALWGPAPRLRWGVLGVSREGLWAAWSIAVRAVLGAAAGITVAATHEPAALVAGLDRLRVPRLLTAIAGFMIRYLRLLGAEWQRMTVAQAARGYQPRSIWRDRARLPAVGTMFVRTYERGERVHRAMETRGYTGRMPSPRAVDSGAALWPMVAVLAVASAATAMAWVL